MKVKCIKGDVLLKNIDSPTIGQRIQLTKTNDQWTDLSKKDYIGTVYEVTKVNYDGGFTQIWCVFDNGSNFAIVPETDDEYIILN